MKAMKILVPGLVAFILLACNKKEDSTPPTQTPKDILMSTQWKKHEYKENGVVLPFFAACEADDVITFGSDNICRITDGAITCPPTGNHTEIYNIAADNKTFVWNYGTGQLSFLESNTKFVFKAANNGYEFIFIKK